MLIFRDGVKYFLWSSQCKITLFPIYNWTETNKVIIEQSFHLGKTQLKFCLVILPLVIWCHIMILFLLLIVKFGSIGKSSNFYCIFVNGCVFFWNIIIWIHFAVVWVIVSVQRIKIEVYMQHDLFKKMTKCMYKAVL